MRQPRLLRFVRLLLLFTIGSAVATCGGDDPTGPVEVATVEIAPADVVLVWLGATDALEATARDGSGATMPGVSFTWSSSDEAVATVSGTGVVTAVGNGSATVTASADAASGSATVRVSQEVDAIRLTPAADTLTAFGATETLEAEAVDAGGSVVEGVAFDWATSDDAVVAVDASGVVTAVGNGEAEISATAGAVSATTLLSVIQQVDRVTVSPSSASLVTVGETRQFTAGAVDSNDNAVENARFVWQSSDPAVAVVDTLGMAVSRGSGAATITASAGGVPGHATLLVDQAVAGLAFVVGPAGATAGTALDPAIQVEIVDAAGNRVGTASLAITLDLGSNPGGGELLGTRTVHAVQGVATFSGLSLEAAGSGYTLAASATGVAGASSGAFDIVAAAPAGLEFIGQPGTTAAGASLTPAVEVQVVDPFGNRVESATAPVTLGLAENPGGDALGGTRTINAVAGVAAFGDLTLTSAASGYTLRATAPGLAGASSGPFDVTAGPKAALRVEQQPEQAEGQEPFTVVVAVEDAYGNRVPGAVDPVVIALTGGAPSAALEGTTTATAVDGLATFDLSLDLPDDGYTLEAMSGSLDPATTLPFEVRLTFTALSRSLAIHRCGVTVPGHAYCWGRNVVGQLGDGTTTGKPYPIPVLGALRFREISTGGASTCGLTTGGAAYCWGWNAEGQLGNGGTTDSSEPVAVSGGHVFVSISVGEQHACGIADTGVTYCWGSNASGQLGDGTTVPRQVPTQVAGGHLFDRVSAGTAHSCGVTVDSQGLCWGSAANGRLGNGDAVTDRLSPDSVQFGPEFISIGAGYAHSCALRNDGTAWCWGEGGPGQLGNGSTTDTSTPDWVDGLREFSQLTVGHRHTCALTPRGLAYCWGGYTGVAVPALVSDDLAFDSIAAGLNSTCGLAPGPLAYCWGVNTEGQLGDGTLFDSEIPIPIQQ